MPYVLLTEEDEIILREIVREVRDGRVNRTPPPETPLRLRSGAAETYVGYGSLTALSGVGTGTGVTPGSGTCEIFALLNGSLYSTGRSETVYNLGESALDDGWHLLTKSKHGSWFVTGGGGATVRWGICNQSFNPYAVIDVELQEGTPDGSYSATGETISAIAPGISFTYAGTGLIGDVVTVPSYAALTSSNTTYGFRPIECDPSGGAGLGTGT